MANEYKVIGVIPGQTGVDKVALNIGIKTQIITIVDPAGWYDLTEEPVGDVKVEYELTKSQKVTTDFEFNSTTNKIRFFGLGAPNVGDEYMLVYMYIKE